MSKKRPGRVLASKKVKGLPAKPPKADRATKVRGGANIEVNYRKV